MIRTILDIYIFILIVNTILSYLPQYRLKPWAIKIRKVSDLTCLPVRRVLSNMFSTDLPFDFSPIVVIILIKLLEALW